MVCLNTETKQKIIETIGDNISDIKEAQTLADFVEQLQECTADDTTKGRKGKRPLSKYNIFISKCAKGTGRGFKSCIEEWRKLKKEKMAG